MMLRFVPVLTLFSLSIPVLGTAQQAHQSASSVVQLRCATPQGEMKATGFVWPEPGMLVTALHAIAGCDPDKSTIFSETARRETQISEFVRVDLEADLALVRMTDDMGLPALLFLEQNPELHDQHSVWGYPLSAEQMVGMDLDFALGLPNQTITLGSAFSSSDLDKLFREQDFPTRETQILRVTSTIQPGHSGAPIFDENGRVVAIADGGLLGGWRGINWSIPAHVYLPELLNSEDVIPTELSQQGILHSNVAVANSVSVKLGDATTPESPTGTSDRSFGRISFDQVLFDLAIDPAAEGDDYLTQIPDVMDPETTYLTAVAGPDASRPLIYPETMVMVQPPAAGFTEFESQDGTVRYITYAFEADTTAEALAGGLDSFLGRLSKLDVPGVANVIGPDHYDPQLEFMSSLEFVEDDFNEDPSLMISVSQNGTRFNGQAVYIDRGADYVSDEAYADYLMATVILENLNSLYPLPAFVAAEIARGTAPGQSELTLVRRVPLSAIEAEIVANQEFQWKSDLTRLKEALSDNIRYEDLRFDVYEDRLTGATIAVPEAMALKWDPESGTVWTSTDNDMVMMAISIQRANDYNTAIDIAWEQFLPTLTDYAEWYGPTPSECYLTFQPADLGAGCFGEFFGYDTEFDLQASANVKVTVKDNISLATFVYSTSDEDGQTDEDALNLYMMLFAAEYLSDFAEM